LRKVNRLPNSFKQLTVNDFNRFENTGVCWFHELKEGLWAYKNFHYFTAFVQCCDAAINFKVISQHIFWSNIFTGHKKLFLIGKGEESHLISSKILFNKCSFIFLYVLCFEFGYAYSDLEQQESNPALLNHETDDLKFSNKVFLNII